jgi:hypothetical protein
MVTLLSVDDFLGADSRQQSSLSTGSTWEQVVGFEFSVLEMGRITTILNMAIAEALLSRDNIQQLKVMLRQNTVLGKIWI